MGWYSKKKNSRYGGFAPYVSVAERRKQAQDKIVALRKKGKTVQPVIIEGRTIAKTFWGKAWCDNLESYSDFKNRLPRGRTYARNGSVIDLQIGDGEINALVSGSSIYTIKISVTAVSKSKWKNLVQECSGKIDSLIELLQGKMSKGLMQVITHSDNGLFPSPKEIKFDCSCPDWADMCKHIAAVLYGIGARFDEKPEDLFLLRKADYAELIAKATRIPIGLGEESETSPISAIKDADLAALFDIDIDIDQTKTETKVKPKTISKVESKTKLKTKPKSVDKKHKTVTKANSQDKLTLQEKPKTIKSNNVTKKINSKSKLTRSAPKPVVKNSKPANKADEKPELKVKSKTIIKKHKPKTKIFEKLDR